MKLTIEKIDASMARWQTRLRRAVNAIGKLEKQKKRLVKVQAVDIADLHKSTHPVALANAASWPKGNVRKPKPEPLAVTIMKEMIAEPPKPVDDIGIPGFLQRKKIDPVAVQLLAEQADTKKRKASGRIAKMKAKKAGELTKMPLTGKAALEAIRG